MPHQCTNCGYVFADGSKEMLTGCPSCSGNKFQYHPGEVPDQPTQEEPPERPGESGVTGTVGKAAAKVRDLVGDDEPDRAHQQTATDSTSQTDSPTQPDSPPQPADQQAASAETTSGSDDAPPETASADSTSDTDTAATESTTTAASATDESARDSEEVPKHDDDEDVAQQSARSEMVSENDLPPSSERPPSSDRGRVVSEPDSDERPDMETLREELNSQFESIRIVSPGKYELNLMELYDREEYIIALQENGRYVIEVPDAWEVENADETE